MMALWPNARYMTLVAGRHSGSAPGLDARAQVVRGNRMNRFVGETFVDNASTPDGYGMRSPFPPIKAGSMSARQSVAEVSGYGALLSGGPMEGDGSFSLSGSAGLSLIVGLEGNAVIASFSGNGAELKLTIGLSGDGSWSLSGTPNLAMIVPFAGSGSFSFSGSGDLRGKLSMQGEWTPYTELSPESLARAVWSALLAQYPDAGTAGKALSTASSGGVDLDALAQAVLDKLNLNTIPVDVKKMNSANVLGSGTSADKWRGE